MPKRARNAALGVVTSSALLFLTGCSAGTKEEWKRVAMPEPASEEAHHMLNLWQWSWVAAMLTGIAVWGLIFYTMIKYRRRSETEVPVQTRYNLPIEIFYTLAPVMMVIVFFYFTVDKQNEVLHAPTDLKAANAEADLNVIAVGQQWSWTFNYTKGGTTVSEPVFNVGTAGDREGPTLYLVKGKSVSVDLYSPDVIHSFWVPAFLFKMDVVPGREDKNHFTFTPDREGTFEGRCAELCGVLHSRMLFQVKVVSQAEFDAHLEELEEQGNTGIALGGEEVGIQDGLEDESNGGEE
jgi:cytochrome c oxidase subunit 2